MRNIDIQAIGNKAGYFDAASMATNLTGQKVDISQMNNYSIQSYWTGTPVGNLVVQESNDGSIWLTVNSSAAGGASGSTIYSKVDAASKYIRYIYNATSSTGALTTKIFAKGF